MMQDSVLKSFNQINAFPSENTYNHRLSLRVIVFVEMATSFFSIDIAKDDKLCAKIYIFRSVQFFLVSKDVLFLKV